MFDSLKKKLAGALRPEQKVMDVGPVFDNFGLYLKVGSHLKVRSNNALIFGSNCMPPKEEVIQTIGVFDMSHSKVYRFWLRQEYFVQVILTNMKEIEEVRGYRLLKVVLPSTTKEWEAWLLSKSLANSRGTDPGFIGRDEFVHYDTPYYRLESWAGPDEDWVKPIEFTETQYSIVEGIVKSSRYINHAAMAYGRWLNEEQEIPEYLLVSAEDLNINGVQSSSIRIYVGMDLAIADLQNNY